MLESLSTQPAKTEKDLQLALLNSFERQFLSVG